MTRLDSKSILPDGLKIAKINYDDEDTLVSALQGQQFLIITLGVVAPPDTQSKLVKAAAKAGVPYIMPNCYAYDPLNVKFSEEYLYANAFKIMDEIRSLGVSSYIVMVSGFGYEWSVALGSGTYGLDIKNRKAVLFDDGKTLIITTCWRQCGRAIAVLLSLKELPVDSNDMSPTVSQWTNNQLYISSFRVSQRDMLDSIQRVTGTTDGEWDITYEPSAERYKNGIEAMQKGDRSGFMKAMYSRVFFQTGDGDFESSRGLDNSKIGLEKDDLDDATKRAVEMVESGWNPFA